ncbi:AtzE family amidohydrolase [Methylocapsa palsarum]|uniref:Amidase/aspartyl-tRNA(Asn)/glutamyl-tRNA(Gln) amidotransferase subunit A n=1 Tax=Methylocapsa palsarum TaxID=1612308 RepID=A0A1I3W0A9_9HYPH|nr:AtzE family amidohydrolase [Methylocapsa palsarum]SFK00905.1 amidase/aspartyl-tRNA(Asn)/glutamyl-tRNA(Gln) amidotransferase subunit A [Methylocapsa palsarum]
MSSLPAGASEIAAGVRAGRFSAEQAVAAAQAAIAARDPALNCFTILYGEAALNEARAVDARIKAGDPPGPLAGVPFGVKELYDIAGRVTLAGSKINRDNPPAQADATLVARMRRAGAVPVGAQNMDEYAYGFSTENAHYGATRNPHDPARIAGGSSGGSAASVAAGMVPVSLGSDTNGSIRVPASLCGVFGLKPTFGRLPRTGTYPFISDLDHLGAFARSVADLALVYDVLQGPDSADPVCSGRPIEPVTPALEGGGTIRAAVLEDWFQEGAGPEALSALAEAAKALGAASTVSLPGAANARAAAFCLTAAEGAALHLADLRARPGDFDPANRDRLLAGALLPAAVVIEAQRLRRWFQQRAAELFARYDLLLAPAAPCVAPFIGQPTALIGGREVLVRPNLGLYTQPISFIGLPVVAAPVHLPGRLPVAVQLIAAPWREDIAFRAAAALERAGVAIAKVAAS